MQMFVCFVCSHINIHTSILKPLMLRFWSFSPRYPGYRFAAVGKLGEHLVYLKGFSCFHKKIKGNKMNALLAII